MGRSDSNFCVNWIYRVFNNKLIEFNEYIKNMPITGDNATELQKVMIGQDKIMDICIKEKADTYINPIGALDLDLYNSELFKNNNMNFFFIKMNDIKYKHFNGEFVSNLSVIDLLMFNSKDELKTMLESYELIRN